LRPPFVHFVAATVVLRLPFFWRDSGPIYAWPPPEETPSRRLAPGMLAYQAALRDGQVL
jgi:hypothetical protein